MIQGKDLEAAEKRLRRINKMVPFPQGQTSIARLDQDAAHAFTKHHLDSFRQKFPGMPADAEVALRTFMFHCLCVGAIAGREDRDKAGS